jgi:hypothetical protein
MFTSYQDQVCIITGASSGLGAAFAQALAQRGARVILFARRADRLEALVKDFRSPYLIVVGDVTQAADRARLIESTLAQFGRVDMLINNAGKDDRAGFLKIPAQDAEQILQTNLVAAILLSHRVAPLMTAQGRGLILNVSSAMGGVGLPYASLYGASKAGLSLFSLALYRELRPKGVHVMNFIPGYTRSEMIPPDSDSKLPPLTRVISTEQAVERALEAALRGLPQHQQGQVVIRLAMFFNRNFPRWMDRLLTYFWRR